MRETKDGDKRTSPSSAQLPGYGGSYARSTGVNMGDVEAAIKKAQKLMDAARSAKASQEQEDTAFEWLDNADGLDRDLLAKSEAAYIDIAKTIVGSATNQLTAQNNSKNSLKKIFTVFFIVLISVQYLALAVLLFIRAFQVNALLSDTVIVTYISSVFLETLGAVIIMIRYAFASDQETKVLEILKSIISSFQKFPK